MMSRTALATSADGLDVRRRVARAHPVGRLAGGVGGAHQPHPAGCQDDGHLARLHQLLGALERHGRHPQDAAVGSAGAPRRLRHDLRGAADAAHGRRVGAEDDRAARLDGDQNLVDGRGRRVGRRHDGGDDAERLGDLDDLPVFDAIDDADRAHRPDEAVHALGREQVLLDLVGDHAEAGLLDGEARQRLRLRRHRRGHGVDDGVDAFLGELGELGLRLPRTAGELAGLLDGGEIAIGAPGGSHVGLCRHDLRSVDSGGRARRLREDAIDFGVRPRDDVHRDQLAHARAAAAAPASVAAFTAPTSPRTITVT